MYKGKFLASVYCTVVIYIHAVGNSLLMCLVVKHHTCKGQFLTSVFCSIVFLSGSRSESAFSRNGWTDTICHIIIALYQGVYALQLLCTASLVGQN